MLTINSNTREQESILILNKGYTLANAEVSKKDTALALIPFTNTNLLQQTSVTIPLNVH
jgi:hypothetical protein